MNTVQFPNIEVIENDAAAWIAAIDRGLSETEQQLLNAWLEQSPLHGETLIKCASMFDMLEILQPISKLMPIDEELPVSVPVQSRALWRSPFAVAASTLLVAGAAVGIATYNARFGESPVNYVPTSNISSNTERAIAPWRNYQTAVGEMSTFVLADGSLLQLNTNSEVNVQYTAGQRYVELRRGEVFFDVAKNKNKPFVVKAGNERVTAIGTAFSVDFSAGSATEIIVTEGKVRVDQDSKVTELAYDEVYLTQGQKVVVRNNRPQVSLGQDAASLLAWREGMVVFQGESLAEVVKEIGRYTPLSFKILDPEIASISVGGFFKTGDLEQLLLVLEKNFAVASVRRGNDILLSKAGK